MSAPLVLSSGDLRHLADALDELTLVYEKHRVLPGPYEHGIRMATDSGDEVCLRVVARDGELVIDDRYGS